MTIRRWICGKCGHENCSCRNTCQKCGDKRGNNKGWIYLVNGHYIRRRDL